MQLRKAALDQMDEAIATIGLNPGSEMRVRCRNAVQAYASVKHIVQALVICNWLDTRRTDLDAEVRNGVQLELVNGSCVLVMVDRKAFK